MGMIKVRVHNKSEANGLKGRTNGDLLKKMSESDILKGMKEDPDAQSSTAYEAAQFRPFIFLKKKLKLG